MAYNYEVTANLDKYSKADTEMRRLDKERDRLQEKLGKVNDRRDALRRIRDEARAFFDKEDIA